VSALASSYLRPERASVLVVLPASYDPDAEIEGETVEFSEEVEQIEEPVVEEAVPDEPVLEEPIVEEPVVEEPVIEEPAPAGADR
jgi:hypothetical protein